MWRTLEFYHIPFHEAWCQSERWNIFFALCHSVTNKQLHCCSSIQPTTATFLTAQERTKGQYQQKQHAWMKKKVMEEQRGLRTTYLFTNMVGKQRCWPWISKSMELGWLWWGQFFPFLFTWRRVAFSCTEVIETSYHLPFHFKMVPLPFGTLSPLIKSRKLVATNSLRISTILHVSHSLLYRLVGGQLGSYAVIPFPLPFSHLV